MPRLLVRPPSPRLADGEVTHLERVPVDPGRARDQWERYVAVFRDRGWDVTEVAPADEQPDGVFIEDAVMAFDEIFVISRPGARSRRGEIPTARGAAEATGRPVFEIAEPGTLDGGDVLKVGRRVYVGRSARTDEEGIRQLAAILEPRGWEVVSVPVTKVLHLKSALTALPDGTVIGYEPLVDDPTAFPEFVAVPEEEGSAVVVLAPDTVLLSASAPRTAAMLAERGLRVVTTPVSEFEKLEGCVTCLSVRLRD